MNALGRVFFGGYTSTVIGQAMLTMMRLIGPKRSLERMQRNFRTGGNYIETRFRELGPNHVELWFNEVNGMPSYVQGIIEAGAEQIGARNVRVEYRPEPEGGVLYTVIWE